MKSAVGYLRVSTIGQLDGNGFDRQRQAIDNFATSNETTILEVFEERGISGKTDGEDRPAFQQMVSFLLSSGCRTVIVEALDRLAREFRVQEQLLIYLASKGISLVAANTGENITEALVSDPMRRALVQIQAVFAELDRNLLVNKLRKARQRVKAATGRCEGRKRFGAFDGEAATLARMCELRAQGRSLETIAITLDREGCRPRSGSRWYPATVARILRQNQTPHTMRNPDNMQVMQ
ncbi:MAG TPA: recombinase family protein [Candidatus Angelobacter sp.]|nr:recombinase family protein [Candidatus Angelobacter sp.]